MRDMLERLTPQLSASVASLIGALPPTVIATVQEIRLRVGAPLIVSSANEDIAFGAPLTAETVRDCLWRLCAGAVHAHEQELARGFVTAGGGFRVGVAGTAVVKDGVVTAYRDIVSLCIRIAREIDGCAQALMPFVADGNAISSLLLCGAPGSGKTTLLRDIARGLSQRYRVAVVDERHELGGEQTAACDILKGCPKAVGILQAVRTLAPDAVIVDELGDAAEWEAVAQSAYLGVPLIASAHIGSPAQARQRAGLVNLLVGGGFVRVAFLPPRSQPYAETRIWEARDLLEDRGNRVCRVCLRGSGDRSGAAHA